MKSGTDLVMVKATATRDPSFTPMILIHARTASGSVITRTRSQPLLASGQKKLTAMAKPAEREATDTTRATQVIHPTSKPIKSPKARSEEHTSELQSRGHLVCRLLLETKKTQHTRTR